MKNFTGYKCSLCGTEYLPGQVTYTCPKDGGNLDVVIDFDSIRKKYQPEDITSRTEPSLWKYLPLLPVSEPAGDSTPLHAAGGTPVFALPRLAEKLGLKHLWLKDESRNPSASFKDRASAILVARAQEIKAEVVVTASTGNAGAALACMAAAVGQKAIIFAPKSAPPAKVAQLLVFGAKVILVDGTYDDAFDLTVKAADEFGWYCRNTGYNPFTVEGKKTAAFEIWEWWMEAHRDWHKKDSPLDNHPPLCIFVSVGDGNIISGIHKGFKDLLALGWIPNMPRIIGVQAEGSAAIANAFNANTETITPVSATTLADSISVDLPRDGVRAVRAAKETGGTYITVADDEIIKSIAELGKMGVFAEPAGATAYAGLVKATSLGVVGSDDPILVMNTGSGLKDVRAAMQAVQSAPIIEPTLEAVKKLL
ncbi:MAG TPA: threonine synthase [Anaerolineales bacterium]|nr:threonine synthase [Anaerolineales bacterium]HMV94681.1 threonine synthase [Anaerolineales bacterium]HNA55925.1 threonine synthase [Anaerolineales bacterium]HNB88203.1 threonine synthase [Anaerolineales bacterium]HND93608.1 threonine synthase [Anaerolineales bacterium]